MPLWLKAWNGKIRCKKWPPNSSFRNPEFPIKRILRGNNPGNLEVIIIKGLGKN